jgi:hypothetical protein
LWPGKIEISVAAEAAFTLAAEPLFKSGCDGADVFLVDVSQQVLFAQHAGWHAFSLGVFDSAHGAAGSRVALTNSAAASTADRLTLLSIALFYSTIGVARRTR